ncbi:MAG TPA: cupin domain-containing protein [Atribacterota bacterium]|nr:cupin domain-containing protein [Atribacterota bacterium]
MKEVKFFRKNDLKAKQVLKSSQLRAVANDNVMITLFDFGPDDQVMPNHHHPHEQITFILKGSVKMVAGGKSQVLEAGQGAVIPPNVEHEVTALEKDSQVLDVFYPLREDYLSG